MTSKEEKTRKVTLSEFLEITKVIKMLYGREFAVKFFELNYQTYISNLNESLSKVKKEENG